MIPEIEIPLREDESFFNYVFRIIFWLYGGEIRKFLTRNNFKFHSKRSPNYLADDHEINWFMDIIEISPADVKKHTLNQFDSFFCVAEELEIGKSSLYSPWVQYCPFCVQEDYYHRLLWGVSMVTVCLKHNTLLVDRCHACKNRIRLFDFMFEHCMCGKPIKEGAAITEITSIDDLEAQKTVQAMLQGKNEVESREYFEQLLYFLAMLDCHYKLPDFNLSQIDETQYNRLYTQNESRGNTRGNNAGMNHIKVVTAHSLIMKPHVNFRLFVKNYDFKFRRKRALNKLYAHARGKIFYDIFYEVKFKAN